LSAAITIAAQRKITLVHNKDILPMRFLLPYYNNCSDE
jgi:hypothetical protein